jgi:hypothetical protein
LAAPLRNSTLVTVPSMSDAVAARPIVAGAANVAPFAGCVSVTLGGESPWMAIMLAKEGTPLASTMNSM